MGDLGLKREVEKLKQEIFKIHDKKGDAVIVGELYFNLKNWEKGCGEDMTHFFKDSPNPSLQSISKISCVLEEPGSIMGSGAAIINTLKSCVKNDSEKDDLHSLPSLGLLLAGEGSRLWGISLALGFVKGLSTVLGTTLVEQTVNQSIHLLSQSSTRGKGLILVAGTDNLMLPSVSLTENFHPGPNKNFFFFSKEVRVLDEKGNPLSESVLQSLTQLGIMLVDHNNTPTLFLEKPTIPEVLSVLKQYGKSSVYFNAFYFAFTKPAAKLLVSLYSRPKKADGVPFFETYDFDWSTHVISPFAAQNKELWEKRYNSDQAKIFTNFEDWMHLYEIAQEFKHKFGGPCVISIGSEAIWYDTGLSSDLTSLLELSVSSQDLVKQQLIRDLFCLPAHTNTINSYTTGISLPKNENYLILNSVFKKGGSIGEGCVIVASVFETEVHIPPNVFVINSKIGSVLFKPDHDETNKFSLVYSYNAADFESSTPLIISPGNVYFSAFVKTEDHSKTFVESGVFPISVVPKKKEDAPYLDYYNLGENKGKNYLEQSILGFKELTSFKKLMGERRVSLHSTLAFLKGLEKEIIASLKPR